MKDTQKGRLVLIDDLIKFYKKKLIALTTLFSELVADADILFLQLEICKGES
jgi:hypothetical protein